MKLFAYMIDKSAPWKDVLRPDYIVQPEHLAVRASGEKSHQREKKKRQIANCVLPSRWTGRTQSSTDPHSIYPLKQNKTKSLKKHGWIQELCCFKLAHQMQGNAEAGPKHLQFNEDEDHTHCKGTYFSFLSSASKLCFISALYSCRNITMNRKHCF